MIRKIIIASFLLSIMISFGNKPVLALQQDNIKLLLGDIESEQKNEDVVSDAITKQYGFNLVQELIIGRTVAYSLLSRFNNKVVTDEKVNHYVNIVGQSIAQKVSKRPQIKYRFGILDTPEINAYACPGGYIFVTNGLLKMINNETELAAVLAHEIGHVENGDGLKDINNHRKDEYSKMDIDNLDKNISTVNDVAKSLPYAGWYASYYSPSSMAKRGLTRALGFIPGYGGYIVYSAVDASVDLAGKGLKELSKKLGAKLIERWFYSPITPEIEYKADEFSLNALAQVGYSPEGMVEFLKQIKDLETAVAVLATNSVKSTTGTIGANESKMFTYRHPPTIKRIENLDALIIDKKVDSSKYSATVTKLQSRFLDQVKGL